MGSEGPSVVRVVLGSEPGLQQPVHRSGWARPDPPALAPILSAEFVLTRDMLRLICKDGALWGPFRL